MPAIAPAIVEKCFLEYTGPLRFISCTGGLEASLSRLDKTEEVDDHVGQGNDWCRLIWP